MGLLFHSLEIAIVHFGVLHFSIHQQPVEGIGNHNSSNTIEVLPYSGMESYIDSGVTLSIDLSSFSLLVTKGPPNWMKDPPSWMKEWLLRTSQGFHSPSMEWIAVSTSPVS